MPDTLAAVLRGEPDLGALPLDLPVAVRTLTRRCLQKDRLRRIADISTARFLLDEDAVVADTTGPSAPGSGLRSRRLLVWSAAAVIAAASLGLMVALNVPAPPGRPAALHLTADIGVDGSLLTANQDAAMLLSPDGTRILFVVRKEPGPGSQLYIRRLDQLGATPLPNTDGARRPFFSPDGEWIGFFADGKLKKLLVSSGAVVALCDAVNDRGGSWGDDGGIIFSDSTAPAGAPSRGTLFRVSSSGGTPEPVTALSGNEVTHRWPQILPDSAAVLYTSHSRTTGFEDATIVVQPLPGGAPKVLVRRAFHARYLKSGHLVYVHEATLFAVPFDLARLEVVGNAVPVIEQLAAETAQGAAGGAQFSVSDSGAIAYLSSNPVGDGTPIEWLGRDGTTGVLRATPASWGNPHFAPDGRHLAVDIYDGRQRDVWIYEEARDTLTRMTSDPGDD